MKKGLLIFLLIILLLPFTRLYAQNDYMINEIKAMLSQPDQKQIDKAVKYLSASEDLLKFAKELEVGGKNKNKAINKKLSAFNEFGSAHKILYSVYSENVQNNLQGANSEQSVIANKSIESASRNMKEAKKNKEASFRSTVPEKSLELMDLANSLEIKSIQKLANTFLMLKGIEKKAITANEIKTEGVVPSNKEDLNKDVVIAKQTTSDTKVTRNETEHLDNSKVATEGNNQGQINTVVNPGKDKQTLNEVNDAGLSETYFKIQIAASKSPLSEAQLNGIYKTNEFFNVDKENEWYKYYVNKKFTVYEEAVAYKNNLKIKGIFVIAFKNGKKVSIEEALRKDEIKKVTAIIEKKEPVEIKSIQETKTIYRLQIGVSTKPMSANGISGFENAGQAVLTFDHNGWYSYNIGEFNSEAEAQNFKKSKSLNDALVVKFVNGVLIEE